MAICDQAMTHGKHVWQILTNTPLIAIGVVSTSDHTDLLPGTDARSWVYYGKPAEVWGHVEGMRWMGWAG